MEVGSAYPPWLSGFGLTRIHRIPGAAALAIQKYRERLSQRFALGGKRSSMI
jgi:hypothetical protein